MAFTLAEREEILNLYKDMRVTDVRDGMDWMGYHHYNSMTPKMRPLWRTRSIGFALTARYIPYNEPVPQGRIGSSYTEWSNWYYAEVCPSPWRYEAQKYDMIVIDQSGLNVGVMGSNNSFQVMALTGASGFVINGFIRDTDEVIAEKIPVWSFGCAQTMDQGRIQYESHNTKINCDGVCVEPEDLVIADNDGVIVVPRKMIFEVAKFAAQEMGNDKPMRKWLYEKAGLPFDKTVDVEITPEQLASYEAMARKYKAYKG